MCPFHECLFSSIRFRLPFNDFEVGIMNHLIIAFSQMHRLIWVCVKVFQQWCENKKGVTGLGLFCISSRLNAPNLITCGVKA